jgi:hypothetical protein
MIKSGSSSSSCTPLQPRLQHSPIAGANLRDKSGLTLQNWCALSDQQAMCHHLKRNLFKPNQQGTAYKKEGAHNQRSTHLLLLSTHASPRTKSKGALDQYSTHLLLLSARASSRSKSKGFHRYVLQIYYFINQVFKSFCSSAGTIINDLALP